METTEASWKHLIMVSIPLLVAFPIQESDGQKSIDVARSWGLTLGAPVCLFVNQPSPELCALLAESGLKTVDLGLQTHVNRFNSSITAEIPWDPWGFKSGPNRDFFRILDYCSHLGTGWTLLAEPDLIPAEADLKNRVSSLLTGFPGQWVIGSQTTTLALKKLDRRLHDHINGAAFYNTKSIDFVRFRKRVWIPSLISLIRNFPFFAYDCVNASEIWDLLPQRLASEWKFCSERFISVPQMINQSNIWINEIERDQLVRRLRRTLGISLHAKIGSGVL